MPNHPYVKTETKTASYTSYYTEEQFELQVYPEGGNIEVLPLSNIPALVPPYFLNPNLVLALEA